MPKIWRQMGDNKNNTMRCELLKTNWMNYNDIEVSAAIVWSRTDVQIWPNVLLHILELVI